jgi:hypothetical protein
MKAKATLMGLALRLLISVVVMVLPLFGAIGINSFGNRVAVDAERFGSVGNALLVAHKGLLDVELLELGQGLIQHDVAVKHLFDYCF